ncbi:hypothetical protein TNCT_236281 [Trichonephila clavata]|uniref:Uncharacterized protein n=1 Tax=Trichonephila clavata TaxID=2740835 RepID=A0A8X6GMD1_TRICU|nr:hypothetical protein TNCT_236281 [Trichonephila clavata]
MKHAHARQTEICQCSKSPFKKHSPLVRFSNNLSVRICALAANTRLTNPPTTNPGTNDSFSRQASVYRPAAPSVEIDVRAQAQREGFGCPPKRAVSNSSSL